MFSVVGPPRQCGWSPMAVWLVPHGSVVGPPWQCGWSPMAVWLIPNGSVVGPLSQCGLSFVTVWLVPLSVWLQCHNVSRIPRHVPLKQHVTTLFVQAVLVVFSHADMSLALSSGTDAVLVELGIWFIISQRRCTNDFLFSAVAAVCEKVYGTDSM